MPPERNGNVARDAFSLAHFPLIAGIVGFAVALEGIGTHPDEPMSVAILASLGVGVALFVGSSALSLRLAGGPLLIPRLAILGLMLAAVVVLASLQLPPVWPLLVVAAALFAIVLTEGAGPETEHVPQAAGIRSD